MRFDLYEQPLRQVSLELKIVFVAVHLPIAGGKTLRIPMIATVGPMPDKSTGSDADDAAR